MDMQFDLAQKAPRGPEMAAMMTPAAGSCGAGYCDRCEVRDQAICADLNPQERAALNRWIEGETLAAAPPAEYRHRH